LLLPRLLGHMRASEVFLLCESISAEKALELGIVNQVVDPSELETLARSVCDRLAQKAPGAVRRTKELLRDPSGGTEQRMQREFELFAEQLRSDEARAAIASFFEKRPKP
jgi:enoyl-CoA hydratase/carnithine racemase